MQLAQRLCYFENAGNLDAINQENEVVEQIQLSQVLSIAQKTFSKDSVSVIYYHPKK
jgi:predicted Zn-dependent peptidase